MWLRDALPYHLPCARIIVYGYDTQLHGSRSFQDLEALGSSLRVDIEGMNDEATVCAKQKSVYINITTNFEKIKPLIFIAHSLGGLIVKEVEPDSSTVRIHEGISLLILTPRL